MNNLKVGDIFVLSKRPLIVVKVLDMVFGQVCLLTVSSQRASLIPVWYSNSVLRGRRKCKRKDWYRAIRQYNKSRV